MLSQGRCSLVLAVGALTGCYVNSDAAPSFESVEVLSPAPGERVLGGTLFTLRLTGRELWGRTVRVEVTRTAEDGAREVVDTVTTRFDEEPDLQTATVDWTLSGDFLDRAQVSELSFVAKFQDASAESGPVVVTTDPRLQSVRLVGTTEGSQVQIGHEVVLEITGTDVAGRAATVEVHRTPAGGEDEVVHTAPAMFDAAPDVQTARFSWTADGTFAERPGRNELYLKVLYADQSLQTGAFYLDVQTSVGPLTVFRNTTGGLQPIDSDTPVPYFDPLTLRVQGAAIIGQDYRVDVLVSGQGGAPLEQFMGTVPSQSFEIDFEVMQDDYPNGVDSLPIVFEVTIGTASGRAPVTRVDLKGVFDCAWYDASGTPIPVDTQFDEGVEVTLRARTWGFEGERVSFSIYEDDAGSDDFVSLLNATGEADRIQRTWSTLWTGDGFGQSNNEYYFELEAAGRTCRSENIRVRKP